MKITEESMQVLEAGIPRLAKGAFQRAHYQALTRSGKVTRAINGKLIESYADGSEKVLRDINSPVKFAMGTKFKLKRRVTAAR